MDEPKKKPQNKNRTKITFNLPKASYQVWAQFLFLAEGDPRKEEAHLQKPMEWRSNAIRLAVRDYVTMNWSRFDATAFQEWRRSKQHAANKAANQEEDESSDEE
jgi:hypothetical protein